MRGNFVRALIERFVTDLLVLKEKRDLSRSARDLFFEKRVNGLIARIFRDGSAPAFDLLLLGGIGENDVANLLFGIVCDCAEQILKMFRETLDAALVVN